MSGLATPCTHSPCEQVMSGLATPCTHSPCEQVPPARLFPRGMEKYNCVSNIENISRVDMSQFLTCEQSVIHF